MPDSRLNQFSCQRIIRVLLGLLLTAALLGCSVARMGYGQLPSLGYWWVDSYLNLNDSQSVTFRTDLQALHSWHQSQELPLLARELGDIQAQALQNTTPAQVCQMTDRFKSRLAAVLTQSEPGFARLGLSLKDEQLQHLKQQLDKKAQTWRDDWLAGSPAEQQARRLERLVERSEGFYGTLSDAQVSLLRTGIQTTAFDAQAAEQEMLRRHQDLLQTLQGLAGSKMALAPAQERIQALLGRSQQSPNASYRAHLEQLLQNNCNTFAQLHNSTTPAQRQKLIARLKGYEDDARTLVLR